MSCSNDNRGFTFGVVDVDRRKPFIDILDPLAEQGRVLHFHPLDAADFDRHLPEIDVLIIRLLKIDASIVERAVRLKAIIKAGVGTDHIDVDAATRSGVHVVISFGNHISVAESAALLMLALSRNLIALNKRSRVDARELGVEAFGKKLGLVGYGRIGRHLGAIARGLGMEVIVYDPLIQAWGEEGVRFTGLKELLSESDYVSLHCPLNAETYHSIGDEQLALMKPGAFLINTARGGIVDEKSLYRALKERRIAGAGLDVFEDEPLREDNPLCSLENVIATPHRLCQTSESIANQMRSMLKSAIAVHRGEVPSESVNRFKILEDMDRILRPVRTRGDR